MKAKWVIKRNLQEGCWTVSLDFGINKFGHRDSVIVAHPDTFNQCRQVVEAARFAPTGRMPLRYKQ